MGGRMWGREDSIAHPFAVLCPLLLCWWDPSCGSDAEGTGETYILYNMAKFFSLTSTKWNSLPCSNTSTWPTVPGIASSNIRWRQRMNDLTNSIWQLHFRFNQIQVREEGYGYTRSWLLPLARQHSCWSSFLWKQLDSDWKTLGSWIRQWQSQQQELNMPLKYLDTVTRTCLVCPADNNRKGLGDAQSWKRHWTFRAWLCSMECWQTGCPALTEEVGLINGSHVSLLEKCFTQAN